MRKIANVFVNIPVKSIAKAYSYEIPAELLFLEAGWRVFVPFGGRKVEGFIVEVLACGESERPDLKPILAAVDEEAWFTAKMLQTASWLAGFYLCSFAESMRLFMPGKSGLNIKVLFKAAEETAATETAVSLLTVQMYAAVYDFIKQRDGAALPELRQAFPAEVLDLEAVLSRLLQQKIICKDYTAKKNAAVTYEKYVELAAETTAADLAKLTRRPAQKHLLELLLEKKILSPAELKREKISGPVVQALAASALVHIREKRLLQDSYKDAAACGKEALTLTADQKNVVARLTMAIESGIKHIFLLHGVTGSGKTQVYIEAARTVRARGQQVVVLVPEIALTGQLVSSFKYYFSQDIIVMHSRLSLSERNDAVLRIRQNEIGIVIGARSALFMPFDNIGVIILDEEHDPSYKQDESPRYHARDVARKMADLHQAVLILGSATPSIESFAYARKNNYELLTLPRRIGNMPLPEVKYVDMRAELKQGNRNVISRELKKLIEETIAQKEQVIIMLNRRGFSTFVMCRSCGEVIKCPDCGLPLVYHKSGKLQCHHCDITAPVPDACPQCSSRYIKYFGTGTERLEHELKELVPGARVIRMDRDTTSRKFAHAQILDQFKKGDYDILLGTQMVAKGHDIPNVTAVGIISADASLNVPDFRSAERCFMLITQTAGRAGRGQRPGRVIVQTYNPEHYAVQCGIAQDYESFYKEEIIMRRQLFYPPYSQLVKLTIQHADEAKALAEAKALVDKFQVVFSSAKGEQIIGPAPAMIANLRGIYRFNLLIKTQNMQRLRAFLCENELQLKTNVMIDINPLNTL